MDNEIVKLRGLRHATSILVAHQIRDAFYIAEHEAVKKDGEVEIVEAATAKDQQADFMVLHEGRIHFRGSGAELLASDDPYLKEFLYRTLPPW